MRSRVLIITMLVAVLALPATAVPPALAEPLAEEAAYDRAALERAVAALQIAQTRAAGIDARIAASAAALDGSLAELQRCEGYLSLRVGSLYRAGEDSYLALLLGATSIPELTECLDVLERVAEQDARTIRDLKTARAQAEKTARALLETQAEQVRVLESLEAEVTRARAEFAASDAALKEYERRRAAAAAEAKRVAAEAAKKAAPARPAASASSAPPQDAAGTGEWRTAVASHYSRTFTGRGASGAPIGPYTMMVAHKTLPFGTLVEFEYDGKRAVASVEDRGPYVAGREWDLGPGVVRALGFNGVHEVRYRIISR